MNKKKKKNKYIPLIVLLVLLAVMLVAYSALLKANAKKEAEEAAELAAENEVLMIAENDYTTTTELSYKIKDMDEWSFAVAGDAWVYTSDTKFPLNQEIIAQMAAAIAQIGVSATVGEGAESDYGLDDPVLSINVKYADGSSHEYNVGNYNSFNSSYYFSADGEMYMVAAALLDYFAYTLDDLMVRDVIPTNEWADVNYVNYVEVINDTLSKKLEEAEEKQGIIDILSSITTDDCADYYADEAEMAAFGLDGEDKVIVNYRKPKTVTDAEGNSSTTYLDSNYEIIFGNEEDQAVYFTLKGSDMVYRMSAETWNEIMAYLN